MEGSSFYLTLPSNASMDIYPDNTASTFQIRLPRTMYLKNQYEVALAEIHYSHSWSTLRENEDYYISISEGGSESIILQIPKGFYRNLNEFINTIHKEIRQTLNISEQLPVRFEYNVITRTVTLKIAENYKVGLSKGVSEILGFPTFKKYTENKVASFKADIQHGFYSLYVYCSICEPQVVGDYYVPLLRTVPIQGHDGDYIVKVYGEPQYVPVNTSKFDVIEINIKDDTGEKVAFKTGKVICKLHFRQKAF